MFQGQARRHDWVRHGCTTVIHISLTRGILFGVDQTFASLGVDQIFASPWGGPDFCLTLYILFDVKTLSGGVRLTSFNLTHVVVYYY